MVEDLLASSIWADLSRPGAWWRKMVLVTGSGGSIGSELCRQIAALNPSSLVLYERYENSPYAVMNNRCARTGRRPFACHR
jgi:FlaA1/EpsC-like NDP-sugar epimerase